MFKRKHDMKKFYDGSKPFEPWTATSVTKVKKKIGVFFMSIEALLFIGAVFFSGVICGVAICYKLSH